MVDITCPNCGRKVSVGTGGRKPLNIGVILVCDTLQRSKSVAVAARESGCSRAYIYKVLKAQGLKVKEVINDNGKSSSQS